MKIFAFGFSPALAEIAEKNRPLSSVLTYDQVIFLSTMANYNLVDRPDDKSFTIYHPDNQHGLDRRLSVCWEVSCSGNKLTYRPHVRALYQRGNDSRVRSAMEDELSYFLPLLGFAEKIEFTLPESTVHLPPELRSSDDVSIMFVSEFKEKFKTLFKFLFDIYKKK